MQVPNQYFESLADRVLALVDEPTLQVVHKRAGVPRWLMGVASMLVLAITALAVWPEQSDTELSADVVDIDVEALLDAADLEDELSLQQLVAFLEVEEIDAVATEGVYEDLSVPILEAADLEELEDLL